ncbi:MAG: rhomboid family intramembrane serine protease [Opitutales bacterium]
MSSSFLHLGILHVVGNLIFLWVFGNTINAHIGNLWYAVLCLGFAICGGTAHMIFDGRPAVGACDLVCGQIGIYVIIFSLNPVRCF